jgi:CelD/BcsL family acetyltransferase involved in cellulose biosynthesis
MAIDTRIIDEPGEAVHVSSAWHDLLSRSASNQPTKSPLWLLAWWKVFGALEARKLRLVLFRSEGRLVGVAPLLLRLVWHVPALPFRRIELLGSGEREADEICSEHLGPIAERGQETAVAEALVAAIAEGRLGGWDEVVLSAMDDDAMLEALERAFGAARFVHQKTITAGCPYISLPPTFDDYLASLRSEQRYVVKRSLRDFEHWADGHGEHHRATTRAELDQGKRVLEALHAERWRAAGKPGVFASPRFRAFHDDVMERLLDQGALDLSWLSVRGRPIAASYNVVWDGRIHFYQSGRTLDVPKKVRPGIVLHAYAIRRAIESGLSEYDFLAGTSQYKLDLATSVRKLACLRAVRSRLRERVRNAALALRTSRPIRRVEP